MTQIIGAEMREMVRFWFYFDGKGSGIMYLVREKVRRGGGTKTFILGTCKMGLPFIKMGMAIG